MIASTVAVERHNSFPEFRSWPFLFGGHWQTICAYFLPFPRIQKDYESFLIPLEDGDRLACRYYPGSERRTIIFFHGLGGSADSNYIQVCGGVAVANGQSVVLVNHRGAGEGHPHARGIYHSGSMADVCAVIRHVREKSPQTRITAVGFSLSANLLLNLAGLYDRDLPDDLIAVNPPIDLHLTARCLRHPRNFIYDQMFVRELKASMRRRVDAGLLRRMPELPRFCRLVDFDERVTAPMAGFRSRDEYYTRCSSIHYASRIRVPGLVLTTEDDPFIPVEPFRRARFSSAVDLHITKTGGHVGYLSRSGSGWKPSRWLELVFKQLTRL